MLYKRGNIWWIKVKADGIEHRRSAGTTSKRTAAEREREFRAELKKGYAGEVPTYRDAVIRWFKSGAPRSMAAHARNTRPFLDDVRLDRVVPEAHKMRDKMIEEGLSPLTANRRLAVVKRVLNLAYKEWDWLQEPLGMKIKMLSEKGTAREVYLSKAEVDELVKATDSEEARKVMILAAYTGLRRGELLGLTATCWQKPYIVLTSKTKSRKPRTVPVIESLHDLVTLPFQINRTQLRWWFEKARKAIGREDIRFHDLRHAYASWLARNPSVPLTLIRDLMGHSSITVTSRYSHLRSNTMEMVKGALEELD